MPRRLLGLAGVVLVGAAAYLGAAAGPLEAGLAAAVVTFAVLEVARRVADRSSVRPAAEMRPPASADHGPTAPPSPSTATDLPALLERVSDAVLVLDARRVVQQSNPTASVLFAPEGGVLVGRPLLQSAWSAELDGVVAAATGLPQEVALPGGRTLLARAFPLPGEPPRTGVVLTEISAARRADRSRSELVANLSHEIRTPVAAARALAETLEAGVDDEARRERYQHQLLTELDRLTAIVDRAMRLSRIEVGAEVLEIAPHDPERLLRTVLQHVVPLAEAADVRLEDVSVPPVPAVRADFDRVIEVLTVLLDNAIKFSPRGGRVTVRAFADPASEAFVTFEVRDEGPGVLPGERERVFERLYTGDPARTTTQGDRAGFGLGLAIARHLVVRHGGRIWIEDVPGAGASFRFTLPAARDGDGTSRS